MLEFNNNHIITGYIKELLANFNLPKYEIYTQEMARFKLLYGKESPAVLRTIITEKIIVTKGAVTGYEDRYLHTYFPYYKDGKIQWYLQTHVLTNDTISETGIQVKEEWVDHLDQKLVESYKVLYNTQYYINKKDLNSTERYIIKNNIYDTATHDYLGNYLRFRRDYEGLNLMPLYNCFNNEICLNATFNFSINKRKTGTTGNNTENFITKQIKFSTEDHGYKIYMLPVKLDKKYTIAIDSECGAELVCGFYDQYQMIDSNLNSFYANTYKKYNSLKFNSPVIYDKLVTKKLIENNREADTEKYVNKAISTLRDICDKDLRAYNYLALLDNLKLFIKIPIECTSSIVILEGDYSNFNSIKWTDTVFKDSYLLHIGNEYFKPKLQSTTIYSYNDIHVEPGQKIEILNGNKIVYSTEVPLSIEPGQALILLDLDNMSLTYTPPNSGGPAAKAYKTSVLKRVQNHYITNYDVFDENSPLYNNTTLNIFSDLFNPISPLQLLEINDGKHHPFSDRLIEYLLENAITHVETEIGDNVKRVQATVKYNCLSSENLGPSGVWIEKLRRILYDYMQVPHKDAPYGFTYSAMRDCLGYVDKDVEHYYTAWQYDQNYKEKEAIATISSIDIYSQD